MPALGPPRPAALTARTAGIARRSAADLSPDTTATSGVMDRRGRLAPMAKVEADRAAQQHRLHRQDHLQPLHDLRPVLPKERTSVGQHDCQASRIAKKPTNMIS